MKYGSVCSGIEAASSAWHQLGWEAQFFSEIEPFPCSVLAHHYPNVPNYGDMTKFKEWPNAAINVLVGGTPCQSFSVAGLRKGLDDPRGNLMLTYIALANRYRPQWEVWENVPGVLSSNGGRDFACLLRGLEECGYGVAYRVLDAQYFGVAQRRRRVFVVGCLGSWQRAAAVLFEQHSLCGNSAPRREKGQEIAGTITKGAFSGGAGGRPEGEAGNHFRPIGIDEECNATIDGFGPLLRGGQGGTRQAVATFDRQSSGEYGTQPVASTVSARDYKSPSGLVCYPINTQIATRCEALGEGTGMGIGEEGAAAYTLQAAHSHAVAFAQNTRDEVRLVNGDGAIAGALAAEPGMKQQTYLAFHVDAKPDEMRFDPHISATLTKSQHSGVAEGMQVRRLTPMECDRLQGFSGNCTLVPHRGKPAADGPRYKALGNSMAVPCMAWIGKRIQMVEDLCN